MKRLWLRPLVAFAVALISVALGLVTGPAYASAYSPQAATRAPATVKTTGAKAATSKPKVPKGTAKRAACNQPTSTKKFDGRPAAHCFAVGFVPDGAHPMAVAPPSTALTPTQIQDAYKLPDAGAGMTVAIVDAFGYGSAEADLGTYRSQFGLPACTTENGCFTKVDQRGGTDYPRDDTGWSIETALDLDAVSAACPKCKILLVQADDNDLENLAKGVAQAASMDADAISNSYGIDGEFSQELTFDHYYDQPGIAVTVSSGDTGNVQSWPATNPQVTAVGGTQLTADSSTRGWAETAWSDAGSGCSPYEPKPDFQSGIETKCAGRANADISADADPASGLAIYNAKALGGWGQYGGTSLSSPLVAAMYALAGKATPGTYPVNYAYRNHTDLNDVTQGTNGGCGNVLCQAGPGWDGPTGYGTPNGVASLTLGATGEVAGTVSDTATGKALAGVRVTLTDDKDNEYTARTGDDGSYDLHAPVGSYALVASLYGYDDQTVSKIAVSDGGKVSKDLALKPKPTTTISGAVTDGSGHHWPMRAKITIDGYPNGAIYSDPFTGKYSVKLPSGSKYTMHVSSADLPGYESSTKTVDLGDAAVTKDLPLPVDAAICAAPGYSYHDTGTKESFTGWKTDVPQDGWTISDDADTGQTWRFDNPGGWAPPVAGDNDFADIDSDKFGDDGVQDSSLISPVVDLSDQDAPEIGFDTAYIAFPDQTGSVDLSLDGGTTWDSVWTGHGMSGRVDVPLPQAAHQAKARVRFHFTGSSSRRWEVDNVLLGSRVCAPDPGGLVAGYVTDANNGHPVNGATVTNTKASNELGVSMATSDDANLADGYYELFTSAVGAAKFKATSGFYAPTTSTVDVAADTTTKSDVALKAGHLTVSRSSLPYDVTLGAKRTKTVTFGNDGTAPLHLNLGEDTAGFTPEADAVKTHGAAKSIVKAPTSLLPSGKGTSPLTRQVSPAEAPWTDIANYPTAVMDDAVASHDGQVYVIGGSTGATKLATVGVYDAARNGWKRLADLPEPLNQASAGFVGDTLYVTGGWNSHSEPNTNTYAYDVAGDAWSKVADLPDPVAAAGTAVVGGKLYIIGGCTTSHCSPMSRSVQSYDPGSNTWAGEPEYPIGVGYVACGAVDASIVCAGGSTGSAVKNTYRWTPGSDAWTPGADLPVADWGAAAASANGRLVVLGGAVGEGSSITNQVFGYDPISDSWTAMPNSNNASYRGGAACGIYKVGGSAGGFNAIPYAEQLPGFDQCGGDVPWLGEDSTKVDLAPGQSVTVKVTVDSSQVSQPGTYDGLLTFSANTPYRTPAPVTVSMQVAPPKSWGKVSGTVTDSKGDGVGGATVAICTTYHAKTGCGPVSYTLKTDGRGRYQLWLGKSYNPLQVIAAKDGFTPQARTARIKRGVTTTVDFVLAPANGSNSAQLRKYMANHLRVAR